MSGKRTPMTDAEREVLRERLASWFGDPHQASLVSDLAPVISRIIAEREQRTAEHDDAPMTDPKENLMSTTAVTPPPLRCWLCRHPVRQVACDSCGCLAHYPTHEARERRVKAEAWDEALRWVRQQADVTDADYVLDRIDRAEPFNPYRAVLSADATEDPR